MNLRNWVVRYYRGGFLASTPRMKKKQAETYLAGHIDGYYMEKVRGLFKGKRIYKKDLT